MAIPPLRRRAGMIEIKEKERKAREEAKKSKEVLKKEVSPEEHETRLKILREMGLLK